MRLRVYTVTSVLFILIATTLIPALAQETPTPEPPIVTPTETATLTLTPTEPPTLTLAPTDAPIPTLTETGTPTATEAATLDGTPSETPTASATIDGTLTETATASASPTGTETATETATATLNPTATSFPPEAGLELFYSQSFIGGGNPYEDLLNVRGRLARLGSEIALQIRVSDAPVTVTNRIVGDAAIQARFAFNSGAVELQSRYSVDGVYSLQLTREGVVTLLRNGSPLATTTVTASAPGQWRVLRLSTIEGVLRASVDGVEVLLAADPAPLPLGALRFVGTGLDASGLLVDDIQVWTPPLAVLLEQAKVDNTLPRMMQPATYDFSRNDLMVFGGNSQTDNMVRVDNSGATMIQQGASPYLSPDGRDLMYSCGVYLICLSRSDGTGETIMQLYDDHGLNVSYPGGFSPNGLWAIYMTEANTANELWIINLQSGAARLVYSTTDFIALSDFTWGDDNNVYFFGEDSIYKTSYAEIITNTPPALTEIDVNADFPFDQVWTNGVGYTCYTNNVGILLEVNAQGDIPVVANCHECYITACPTVGIWRSEGSVDFGPDVLFVNRVAWSPDGDTDLLAIAGAIISPPSSIDRGLYNFSTDTLTNITTASTPYGSITWERRPSAFEPDCSATTDAFVFAGIAGDGGEEDELLRAGGGVCTPLTLNIETDSAPDASPTSETLVFVRDNPTTGADLYTTSTTGDQSLVVAPGSQNDPAWSPDGTQVAYSNRDVNGLEYVYIVNADGSNNRRLNYYGGKQPTWSPDGAWITYVNSAGDLSVVEADCDGTINCVDYVLYSSGVDLSEPAWSPTGQYLMVVERGATSSKVTEIRLTTSGAPTVQGTPVAIAQGLDYASGIAWATNGQSVLATVKRSNSGTIDPTTVVERWTRTSTSWNTFRLEGQPLVYGKDGVFLRYQEGGISGVEITVAVSNSNPLVSEIIEFTMEIVNGSNAPVMLQEVNFGWNDVDQGTSFLQFTESIPFRSELSSTTPQVIWNTGSFPRSLNVNETAILTLKTRVLYSGDISLAVRGIFNQGVIVENEFELNVPITQIDFTDPRIRSVIFWAVFHETSEDEYFSGNATDVPNAFYPTNPNQFTAFLNQSPYCVPVSGQPLGGNLAPDENLSNGWDNEIQFITHCNPPDHRLFYVHGVINNLIIRERASGTNRIMEYFSDQNWSESFGDPVADIWQSTSACQTSPTPLPYASYELAYQAGLEARLNWLYAYLECQRLNTSSDSNAINRRQYLQVAYGNIIREIDIAVSNLSIDPTNGVTTMIQINNGRDTASQFVTDIANCQANIGQQEAQSAYSTDHIPTIRPYNPNIPTILRPALRAELEDIPNDSITNYQLVCYQWVTFSFQIGNLGFRR